MAYAVVGNIAFSLQGPTLKVILRNYPQMTPFELLYWYLLVMIFFNYFFIRYHGEHPLNVGKQYRNIVVFRSMIGFSGVQGKVAALKYMPLSTSSCIFFTLPIWATILAHFVLSEKISKLDVIQLILSFTGVIIINNPFDTHESDGKPLYSNLDLLIGSAFSLSGAIGGSMAVLCMRYMNKGIHYSISPFWFASGGTFMSPIAHSFQTTQSKEY